MTKERYIELRNSPNLPLELCYDYYCSKIKEEDRLVKSSESFNDAFLQFIQTFPINFESIFEKYDNKFNVTKIINIKESKIIRYA